MKNVESLKKGGLPSLLFNRVKDGEKRTINEWAEELDILPRNISSALGRLRKVNAHLHPVGTVVDFSGKSKQGVVVDIMEKEEWFKEVYDRSFTNRLHPAIKDYFRKTELGREKFPQLRHALSVTFNTLREYFKLAQDNLLHFTEPKPQQLPEFQPDVKEILKVK